MEDKKLSEAIKTLKNYCVSIKCCNCKGCMIEKWCDKMHDNPAPCNWDEMNNDK